MEYALVLLHASAPWHDMGFKEHLPDNRTCSMICRLLLELL